MCISGDFYTARARTRVYVALTIRAINDHHRFMSDSPPRQGQRRLLARGNLPDFKSNYLPTVAELLPPLMLLLPYTREGEREKEDTFAYLIRFIRFVWRALSPHGNDSNTASRRPGWLAVVVVVVVGYARQRHTPVNFYRNTFRREMGEFPFVGETTRRIYMILCARRNKVPPRTKFLFCGSTGRRRRKFGRISPSSALIYPSPPLPGPLI